MWGGGSVLMSTYVCGGQRHYIPQVLELKAV